MRENNHIRIPADHAISIICCWCSAVAGTVGILIKNKRQRDQQLLEAKLGLEAEEPLLGMLPEQQSAANGGQEEEGGWCCIQYCRGT